MQRYPIQTLTDLSSETPPGRAPANPTPQKRSPATLLLKLCLFAASFAAGIHFYFTWVQDGDWIHAKFSAPPSPSLIIGSSRGQMGLQPSIFSDSRLEFERPLYNFCFNGAAKFGPDYYRHVMSKVKPGTRHGLFIIEVGPLLFAAKSANAHADSSTFVESNSFVRSKVVPPGRINYDYLFKYFDDSYYRPLFMKALGKRGKIKRSADGWVDAEIQPMDSATHAKRVADKVKHYKADYFPGEELAPLRLEYLKRMATELGKMGRVVLVRTPIDPEMLRAETEFLPEFDSLMVSMADELSITFLNFSNSSLRDSTYDGSHLYSQSARTLCNWIVDSLAGDGRRASVE
ncbi:MAG: hypothetical protein ABI036_20700 [Fibrobacteria bacterium]